MQFVWTVFFPLSSFVYLVCLCRQSLNSINLQRDHISTYRLLHRYSLPPFLDKHNCFAPSFLGLGCPPIRLQPLANCVMASTPPKYSSGILVVAVFTVLYSRLECLCLSLSLSPLSYQICLMTSKPTTNPAIRPNCIVCPSKRYFCCYHEGSTDLV